MRIVSLFLILISCAAAKAAEMVESNQAIRSLGMGGVYITVVKDTDVLFYNPAALTKIEGLNWQLFNIGVGTNKDTFESVDNLRTLTDSSSPSEYNRYFGKKLGAKLNAKSAFAMPYFGFAAFENGTLSATLHNPAYPTFDTTFLNDYGFLVGGAVDLGSGLSFGATVKRISRWGGQKDIGIGHLVSGQNRELLEQFKTKGTGHGLDASLMYSAPVPFNPTLAVVWQDIGQTSFARTDGTENIPMIKDNLSVGVGTNVDLPGLDWSTSLEMRHLTDSSEQIGKKVHVGTEVSLPLIDLRAGMNQGYQTYGVGVNFFFLRVDAAYYKEELGVYPGQTPDTRAQIGVSLDLSFDANFKFTDNNGKRRRLKQRR